MTPTALATKNEPAAPSAKERRTPEIPPKSVVLDSSGQRSRSWWVRLPEDFTVSDIPDTQCWRKVQANQGCALRRHDAVYLIAWDESWVAECIVTDANATEASLSKPLHGLVQMQSRIKALLDDGTYHVEWYGSGFVVKRNADGALMTQPVANETLANRELAQLYPRTIS